MRAALAAVLGVFVALTAGSALATDPPRRTYSVVIGSNLRPATEATELRYAFADAARMYRLLSGLNGPASLFGAPGTIPGGEDADVRADMRPVSLHAVQSRMREIARFAAGDRARGIETHLVVYYSGHGVEAQVPGESVRRGYLPFGDDEVDGRALLGLLDLAGTDFKHLIIDACHATAVARDARSHSEPGTMSRSLQAGIAQRPEIGLITAETQQRQAIELDRLRGGQLTHFVHSGLTGLADADDDQRVSYAELYRFAASGGLWSARRVQAMRMRVEAPHGNLDTALLDLRWRQRGSSAPLRFVRVLAGPSARFRAYTDGELYAHWRSEEGFASRLLVPRRKALEIFRCVRCGDPGARELRILEMPANTVPGVESVVLAPAGWRPFAVRAVDDWSWGLFPLGYGPEASRVIELPEAVARRRDAALTHSDVEPLTLPVPTLPNSGATGHDAIWPAFQRQSMGRWGYVGVGLLGAGAGLAAGVAPWAFVDRDRAVNRALDDTADRNAESRARARHALAIGALVSGVVLAAGGSALLLWDRLLFSPTPGGAAVELSW